MGDNGSGKVQAGREKGREMKRGGEGSTKTKYENTTRKPEPHMLIKINK